jgi:hypothetical protein
MAGIDDLLTYARETVGVAMGSIHQGRHIGYTTDDAKATKLREAGAHVTRVRAQTKDGPDGWEISFLLQS